MCFLGLAFSKAEAHPHVWIEAKAELVYIEGLKLQAIRHHWTFDEAYSVFAVQGLDKKDGQVTPDALKALAKTNVEALSDFDYFTSLKANSAKQTFGIPEQEQLVFEKNRLTLSFLLPLKASAQANKLVSLDINDPTFFVSFTIINDDKAVQLEGASAQCLVTINRPKQEQVQQSYDESFFANLQNTANLSFQLSNRVLIVCP